MELKSMMKSVIHRLGFEVHRITLRGNTWRVVPIEIGPYQLMMYGYGRPQQIFAYNPAPNGALRRLIALAVRKYTDLALIDVGASFGDTVAVAKMSADIPVLCLEGNPRAYQLLEQNIRQFSHVTARNVLLGERVEDVPVVFEKEEWNLTVIPQDSPSSTIVSLTTLDECVRSLEQSERYRVLKVDVEGFDCRIIRGGMSYIERVKPTIIMEYNRGNMKAIGEAGLDTLWRLRDAGYQDILFYDNSGRLVTATTLHEEKLLRDMHEYASGPENLIWFFDLCLFHATEADLAEEFTQSERALRHH